MKKWYYSFLFLMASACAISCGNNSSQNQTGQSESSEQSYREAVKNQDFESARDILNTYHVEYKKSQSKNGILYKDERKEAEGKYYNAFDYIYKAEIQYLLSELEGDECKDKIMFLLEEIPIEGEKFPKGLCEYRVACRGTSGDEGIPLDAYIIWTQHFNRLCSNILSLAINRKNQDLAKLILLHFVENVEVTKGRDVKVDGVLVDGNHGYIKYTTEDKDAAKAKYDEAVANGAFK